MSTPPLFNGMSGNLQSSSLWSQQQALELIQRNVTQAMSSLSPEQRRLYITLHRQVLAALKAVEEEKDRITSTFKRLGLAQLRARLDGRDPEQYFLYTTYLEKREIPLPWEPRSTELGYRLRRATDEVRYKEHIRKMSLWDAACLNFGYTHSVAQESGYSLVQASEVVGPNDDRSLTTLTFINIARELDLGNDLKQRTDTALAAGGTLRTLIEAATLARLRFDALEAYRDRTNSGVTQAIYDRLDAALVEGADQPSFDTLSIIPHRTPIGAILVVPWETHIPLPLMLIKVASLGVLSYFPSRPTGALQYHTDTRAAETAFHQQLRTSHERRDLGWFSRQLPVSGLAIFRSLLDNKPRPQGMNWLAGLLYDGFHKALPKSTLENLRFRPDIKAGRPETLVQALTYRHIQRYHANLQMLATTKSAADWQALKDGAAAIVGEILEMLLIPLPGGVTGMNHIMLTAVMGSLAYSFSTAVNEALKGDPSGLAAALTDIADLAISARLMGVAGQVHRRRVLQHLQALGNPRKIITSDGQEKLWRADAHPYAIDNQQLLEGQTADALGIYTLNGQHYAKLQHGSKTLVVEVAYNPQLRRYGLNHPNGDSHHPTIVFDPMLQYWVFDLQNAHTLSDLQLLHRMLPNGSAVPSDAYLEKMLRSTATTRTTLDDVWSAKTAVPLNLTEGVRRLQVDRVIQQIIDDFPLRASLPTHADSAVFGLLTQLPDWPADLLLNIHDPQGQLIESYGPATAPSRTGNTLDLKRLDDGSYVALDEAGVAPPGEEHLMQLIIARQPASSSLGKDELPNRSQTGRIALVREQVAALAKAERPALFKAMFDYAGREQSELIVPLDIRRFLPHKTTSTTVTLTPLLKKLRDLNPPLSAANLQYIMLMHPLSPQQQQTFLAAGTLPTAFAEQLEHHRIALRIDAAIDGLYHPRAFNQDIDLWAREFASALVRKTLQRHFVVTEVVDGVISKPYVSSGVDDLTVELRHYGNGRYEAWDQRNASAIAVSPLIDSFYLAIGAVLQPHERAVLGMQSATDATGLRKTLGDFMSDQRSPEGFVSLVNGSLAQYEQSLKLPPQSRRATNGIVRQDGKNYLPLFGSLYRITFDKTRRKWRLRHPEKVGVDTPLLEHNGDGAWRLASENPMHWDNHRLFTRLGHSQYNFPESTADRILALTDTSPQTLRQVHRSGQPAPPLLADTCKRFTLEQQLQLLIKSMRSDPTSRTAHPSAQLLILFALPGWPESHNLQITDSQGQVVKQYPTTQSRPQNIQISEMQYLDGKLLSTLVMNNTVTQGLLGELPVSVDERLSKLVKKIVAHAESNLPGLFDSFYAASEREPGEPQNRLKRRYPDLPNSALNAMLERSTPRELKQLREKDKVGLRLSEQARLSAAEVRLNRAYEGLLLDALGNPDSDKITLHLLKSVPGWPATARLDIYQESLQGTVIASGGHLSGPVRKRVLKTDLGYQAEGSASPPSSLVKALAHTLDPAERAAMGILDGLDSEPLREQIAQLAFGKRVEIKGLLGLPHLQPWQLPPMQVDSSFKVYFWRWLWPFGGNQPPDLIAKVKTLYPSFDTARARDFIRSLNLIEPAALVELDRRQAEYTTLETELRRWAEGSNPDHDTPRRATDYWNLAPRRAIMDALLKAWRRENPTQLYLNGMIDVSSLVLDFGDHPLPPASIRTAPEAFAHIEHLGLSGERFPAEGNGFLRRFTGLSSLTVDCAMTDLPTAITDMPNLNFLNLSDNRIRLTEESGLRLAGLSELRGLYLNSNPLGLAPDVSRMTHLRSLELRNTGINQWPHGTWNLTSLEQLHLQENRITEIPDAFFTTPSPPNLNRQAYLHGNPFNEATRRRIDDYYADADSRLANAQAPAHIAPGTGDFDGWLAGIPAERHEQHKTLWQQLLDTESPRPDDCFEVLRDLTKTSAYTRSREALTARVWVLLEAMGQSTELRNNVFNNTYGAGNCGDSVLLAFTDMELEHRIHLAKSMPSSREADQALLKLSKGVFYLKKLKEFSYTFADTRERARLPVDRAEVTVYLLSKLAVEFDLPLHPLELLYSVDSYVTPQVINEARKNLRQLAATGAPQEMLLSEKFWIEYLVNCLPEPFVTIREVTREKIQILDKEVSDRQSDTYLEQRQSIVDRELAERLRLIRQLTEAAQAAVAHN
ncbi:NEL-type E3 ubiquitin ligase domain-containing protein [Pseudomonas graminis]